ncbi:hypothetical protein ACS0TY_018855 [Phlomoides rotata]
MTTQVNRKCRLVRCPKCLNFLPELPEISVYKCGGCGTVLQAKLRKLETSIFIAGPDWPVGTRPITPKNPFLQLIREKSDTTGENRVTVKPVEPILLFFFVFYLFIIIFLTLFFLFSFNKL